MIGGVFGRMVVSRAEGVAQGVAGAAAQAQLLDFAGVVAEVGGRRVSLDNFQEGGLPADPFVVAGFAEALAQQDDVDGSVAVEAAEVLV